MKYIHTLLLSFVLAFCISTTTYAEDEVMFETPVQYGPGFYTEYPTLSKENLIVQDGWVLGYKQLIIEPLPEEELIDIGAAEVSIPITTPSNRWGITLTDEEKYMLSQIVYLESGNQSDLGQQAVIETIFNRITSSNFPDNLVDVLSQKGQFSTWKSRNRANPTNREFANIDAVLNGNTNIFPAKTVFFSREAQNKRVQARIQDHVFCNEK